MKRKILPVSLFLVLVLPCLILVGCFGLINSNESNNDTKTEFTTSHIYKDGGIFANSYTYTGKPITVDVTELEFRYGVSSIEASEFEFSYENNINVGTASLVITCKDSNPYLYGVVKREFKITHKGESVTTLDELREKLLANYSVGITNLVIPEGETLEIPKGSVLYLKPMAPEDSAKIENYGTIINNGELEIGVKARSNSQNFETRYTFVNEGKFVNNGALKIAGTGQKTGFDLVRGKFFQSGIFENNGSITNNGGNIYANEVFDVETLNNGEFTLRSQISIDDVKLTDQNNKDVLIFGMTYVADAISVPNVSIAGGEIKTLEVKNNDHAGTAEVYIKVDGANEKVYGEITVPFKINKGVVNNITTFEMLKTYKENGNYGTFNCDRSVTFVIPENETFEIAEDETLNLSNLEIRGNLINKGTLIVGENKANTHGLLMLSVGKTLENSGTIKSYVNTEIYGEVRNTGSISILYADYTPPKANFYGTSTVINNSNILIKTYNTQFKDGYTLINNEKGAITFDTRSFDSVQYVIFENTNIENHGKISIDVKAFFYDAFTKFENVENGFSAKNGHVWTFYPLENAQGNITVYKRLSDVSITLFEKVVNQEVVYDNGVLYDTNEHKPSFKVEGKTLDSKLYTISYAYEGEEPDAQTKFIKTGKINVTIEILPKQECDYGGAVTVSYEILKSVFTATNSTALSKACANENYEKVVLGSKVTLYDRTTLVEGGVLDTNGYQLKITANFTNYGSIVVSNNFDGELTTQNCALWITNNALLSNYGRIQNSGLILAERVFKTEFVGGLISNGEIENNGVIYTSQELETTGNGSVIVRRDLGNPNFTLEYQSVAYNERAHTPTVTFVDDQELDVNQLFDITYRNNTNAGTAYVGIALKTGQFDETYALVGDFELSFTIERAIKEYDYSYYTDSLQTYLNNKNYYKVLLTRDITFSNYTLTVPSGMILDFGLVNVTFNDSNAKTLISLEKGAEIWVGANSSSRVQSYAAVATKIYFTESFGEGQTITLFKYVTKRSYLAGVDAYSLVIDLNGYTFYGKMSLGSWVDSMGIPQAVSLTIVDSSENKTGCLGSENSNDYALEIAFSTYSFLGTSSNVVNLNGVKIAGLYIVKDKNDTIKVSDCTLVKNAAGLPALYIKGYNNSSNNGEFKNCTFEGETAVYLEGDILNLGFVDCTFIGNGEPSSAYHGAAIYANSSNATMSVKLTGGKITSKNGNGIEIYKGQKSYFTISKDVIYDVTGEDLVVLS